MWKTFLIIIIILAIGISYFISYSFKESTLLKLVNNMLKTNYSDEELNRIIFVIDNSINVPNLIKYDVTNSPDFLNELSYILNHSKKDTLKIDIAALIKKYS